MPVTFSRGATGLKVSNKGESYGAGPLPSNLPKFDLGQY